MDRPQDDETGQSKGMTLTLSDWFYEGILMDGGLLAIEEGWSPCKTSIAPSSPDQRQVLG